MPRLPQSRLVVHRCHPGDRRKAARRPGGQHGGHSDVETSAVEPVVDLHARPIGHQHAQRLRVLHAVLVHRNAQALEVHLDLRAQLPLATTSASLRATFAATKHLLGYGLHLPQQRQHGAVLVGGPELLDQRPAPRAAELGAGGLDAGQRRGERRLGARHIAQLKQCQPRRQRLLQLPPQGLRERRSLRRGRRLRLCSRLGHVAACGLM
mmetsp:Transcript_72469/g.207896  ORF Transcript_72469/g.207896 Transcript_72469/m.207896 type:complete len:209 (+) Transcript_72469:910-1536(+)